MPSKKRKSKKHKKNNKSKSSRHRKSHKAAESSCAVAERDTGVALDLGNGKQLKLSQSQIKAIMEEKLFSNMESKFGGVPRTVRSGNVNYPIGGSKKPSSARPVIRHSEASVIDEQLASIMKTVSTEELEKIHPSEGKPPWDDSEKARKSTPEDDEPSKLITEQDFYNRKKDGKYKAPPVIGVWDSRYFDHWLGEAPPRRNDKEKDYFANHQFIQSYLDKNWSPRVRNKIYAYLRKVTPSKQCEHIVLNQPLYDPPSPYQICQSMPRSLTGSNWQAVCTDGTYYWSAALPFYIRCHALRPPKFFVKHILRKIKEEARSERPPTFFSSCGIKLKKIWDVIWE